MPCGFCKSRASTYWQRAWNFGKDLLRLMHNAELNLTYPFSLVRVFLTFSQSKNHHFWDLIKKYLYLICTYLALTHLDWIFSKLCKMNLCELALRSGFYRIFFLSNRKKPEKCIWCIIKNSYIPPTLLPLFIPSKFHRIIMNFIYVWRMVWRRYLLPIRGVHS